MIAGRGLSRQSPRLALRDQSTLLLDSPRWTDAETTPFVSVHSAPRERLDYAKTETRAIVYARSEDLAASSAPFLERVITDRRHPRVAVSPLPPPQLHPQFPKFNRNRRRLSSGPPPLRQPHATTLEFHFPPCPYSTRQRPALPASETLTRVHADKRRRAVTQACRHDTLLGSNREVRLTRRPVTPCNPVSQLPQHSHRSHRRLEQQKFLDVTIFPFHLSFFLPTPTDYVMREHRVFRVTSACQTNAVLFNFPPN
jgi:hypothetical protein